VLPETKRDKGGPARAETARFEPAPGTVVAGKYRIERTLGEGGMGIVVAATHLDLDQRVAIKFLLPEALRSQVAVERFLREARVAAKVRSEYVARVHDVGTVEGGVPYIVMEYLEGEDLGQLIDAKGPCPLAEACEIVLQACEALAEVHTAGIVHRDLKPSNLFVTRRADGSPAAKLLDFGISKLSIGDEDGAMDPALTSTATIMGSPSYMSPEQLKSTKEVDARTDVWSLGAVLYEAPTGRPAFRGENVPQVCALIASEDPPPPSGIRDNLPPELEEAILGCLEKDPDRRMSLAGLSMVLAQFAPARGKASLDRILATLGAPPVATVSPPSGAKESREGRENRDTRESRSGAKTGLPILPLASQDRRSTRLTMRQASAGRTVSSWDEERGRTGRGGALFLLLVAAAASVLVFGLYTGRFTVGQLQGEIQGATSAVQSAAGAVHSAVSSVASSLPSTLPSTLPEIPPLPSLLPPNPFEEPSAAPDAGTETEDDDGETPGESPSAKPAGSTHAPTKGHPAKPVHHPKTIHRRYHS
jgi:serine/threonine protein kinase